MSCFIPEKVTAVSKTESENWPSVWPCKRPDSKRNDIRKKRNFGEPCGELVQEFATSQEPEDDFANHLELWHARIPPTCPSARTNPPMVDRAVGQNHSLVSGDYILTETVSKKKGNRVYASICLRGLIGMHLPELDVLRSREKTWKWCFYQAVVALLVKTQLRYKYAWSGNVDYIYNRGWNLFTHMGNINVKTVGTQKLDEVGIYNYVYDVEVELVQEMKDIPRITNVGWDFVESNHGRLTEIERKDLLKFDSKIGVEKRTDEQTTPVHKGTKEIEKWFDRLPYQYQNCIFRTNRYCLAFWKEGLFWYLYNPYRCNDFGFWDDTGYACIMKFCSRNSLKRHLMVLLLRAYVYKLPEPKLRKVDPVKSDAKATAKEDDVTKMDADLAEGEARKDLFTIQIFQMIYKKCKLKNMKLLEGRGPKPMLRPVKNNRTAEVCPYDPLDSENWCDKNEEIENRESPDWLRRFKVTWTRCPSAKKRIVRDSIVTGKLRWHQYYVEEPRKLFSLWGEIHPTQTLFPPEHRGKQSFACYVVCAGMTRITAPEYWSSKTLDAVVMCGDKYYTMSMLEAELKAKRPEYANVENWGRYLSKNFKIGETVFHGSLLPDIAGKLYVKSSSSLWVTLENMFLEHPFAILTCESTCVGIFKFCGAYYMCDAHSTGPPLFQYGCGVIYLIRTTTFSKLINVLTLTIASTECSDFVLNPIQISSVVDIGPMNCSILRIGKKIANGKRRYSYKSERKAAFKKSRSKASQLKKKTINKADCKGDESPCEAAGYLKPPIKNLTTEC